MATTLRTLGGSMTLHDDGTLEVVHTGAAVSPAKKAVSPSRYPIGAVERLEHVPQTSWSGGHLRVHLRGDERPASKPTDDVRVSQLKHLRGQAAVDVDGFVRAVTAASAAAQPVAYAAPVPPAPQHVPARPQPASATPPQHTTTAPAAVASAPAPGAAAATSASRQERRLGRLAAVAEFATWVQLVFLVIALVLFVAFVVGVLALVVF